MAKERQNDIVEDVLKEKAPDLTNIDGNNIGEILDKKSKELVIESVNKSYDLSNSENTRISIGTCGEAVSIIYLANLLKEKTFSSIIDFINGGSLVDKLFAVAVPLIGILIIRSLLRKNAFDMYYNYGDAYVAEKYPESILTIINHRKGNKEEKNTKER